MHQCILCIVRFLCRYKKVSHFCTVGSRLRCQGCIGGGALCHSSLAVGTGGDLWDPRSEPGQPSRRRRRGEGGLGRKRCRKLGHLTPAPHSAPILLLFTPHSHTGCVSRKRQCVMNFTQAENKGFVPIIRESLSKFLVISMLGYNFSGGFQTFK